ncbi:MAG: hypothetical protein CVU57_14750 [Deltaproteobacteria bacterium HGW-Deltaproteobacteria-15]|jgi:hypothetical protein|nr:MAG: hypothetical protein CVU57_14750 [Deltaproteobacteria bacterium HGW-Deltaproteobacteria-15]
MKIRSCLAFVVFVALVSLSYDVQAVMHKVNFNAWTEQNQQQGKLVIFRVDVFDDEYAHPPEYVKSIKITAPNGQTRLFNLSKDWRPFDGFFATGWPDEDFTGGTIPGGTYKVTVTPMSGTAITDTDAVAASFLPIPVLTSPNPNGSTVFTSQTPTITWNAVSGAAYYTILLRNNSAGGEYVYDRVHRPKSTPFRSYQLPIGTLKPSSNYAVMIEARAASQDLDKRSSTPWIPFKTGSW